MVGGLSVTTSSRGGCLNDESSLDDFGQTKRPNIVPAPWSFEKEGRERLGRTDWYGTALVWPATAALRCVVVVVVVAAPTIFIC